MRAPFYVYETIAVLSKDKVRTNDGEVYKQARKCSLTCVK